MVEVPIFGQEIQRNSSPKPGISFSQTCWKASGARSKKVVSGVDAFRIAEDGKKLLAWKERELYLVDPKPEQKLETRVSLDGMTALVDPRAEWRQMFDEAWRLQRDFFYDPNMHGVDWNGMRERYGALLADCASRSDLSYVIKEMISELNVGHAYYFDDGPPGEAPARARAFMAGIRTALDRATDLQETTP